ncbi:MAG: energy transducer TonB [Bryobacteraceae bacterium]
MEHPEAQPQPQPQAFGRMLLAADLDEPWFKSVIRSLREAMHPTKLPPLELTSRPLEEGPIGSMGKPEESWFRSFRNNLRDFVRPPKLPPLEVTSKPVEVGSIWGAYKGGENRSRMISVVIHVVVIALLFLLVTTPAVQQEMRKAEVIYLPKWLPPAPKKAQGGGGQKLIKPVSKGTPPKPAIKKFIAPKIPIPKPKLPVAPRITAPLPPIVAENYADPLSKLHQFSPGQGAGGGIGNGSGSGFNPGQGGGVGGGVYQIGGDVSEPVLLVKVEPEYSEEARKAKYSGTVMLSIIVDKNGLPRDIKVVRPLGLGLDQKAIEAVSKWRFKPAMKDGHPVAVQANVEVNFRLL